MPDVALPGAQARPQDVASLSASLERGETVLCTVRATEAEIQNDIMGATTVVLTDARLLLGKSRTFGKARLDATLQLGDFTGSWTRPDTRETWLRFGTRQLAVLTFPGHDAAQEFERRLRSAARPADEHRNRLGHMYDFADDLAPFATPAMLGEPFGEGKGLDEAVDALIPHLPSMREMRALAELMLIEMTMAVVNHQMARDMSALMGATADVARARRFTDEEEYHVRGLGNAGRLLMAEFMSGGDTYDEWSRDDDLAIALLCWHTIARLRLATAGQAPSFRRPAWAAPARRS